MSEQNKPREAILARIRALTKRTQENGCTEAEARVAAAKVDELLGQYEVDLTELELQSDQEIMRSDIAGLARHEVRYATRNIGKFTDCKVWLDNGLRDVVYLGFEVDVSIAEYLTMMFMRAIDREGSSYTMFNADYALSNSLGQKQMLTSFRVGCSTRLGERLLELKSKRDFTQKSSGTDLVAIKKPIIDEAFATFGISLGKVSAGHSIKHAGAYGAGRTAADGVSINQGVAGRASQGGRLR